MNKLLAFAASALVAAAAAGAATAQVAQDQGGAQTIVVPKDKSAAFRLDYAASQIVVAQPDTLSLVATTDRATSPRVTLASLFGSIEAPFTTFVSTTPAIRTTKNAPSPKKIQNRLLLRVPATQPPA